MKRQYIIFFALMIFALMSFIYLARSNAIYNADVIRDRKLVEYFRSSKGKPYQWKAKEVVYDYNQVRRAILIPRTNEGSKEQIREQLDKLEREIEIGLKWPQKKLEFIIPFTHRKPVIDGIKHKYEWTNSLIFNQQYKLNAIQPESTTCEWRLMYDYSYLYFYAKFYDNDIIYAKGNKLYNEDALELFIMPEIRYHTYVELVFSPEGKTYSKWVSQGNRSRFELSNYVPKSLKVATHITNKGYSVEGRIGFMDLPAYLLGNHPESGQQLRIMMLRINQNSLSNKKSYTPVPFLYDGHNFFGYMKLTLGDSTKDKQ